MRRGSWQHGFGDGFSQAIGMVAIPAVFVLLGVVIDRWLGIAPVFAVTLGAFAVVGVFLSTWFEYKAKMDRAEAGKPWARSR